MSPISYNKWGVEAIEGENSKYQVTSSKEVIINNIKWIGDKGKRKKGANAPFIKLNWC
jgi:hypothetical protein